MTRLALLLPFCLFAGQVQSALPTRDQVDGWLKTLGASDNFDASKGIDWGVMPGPFYTPELGLGVGTAVVHPIAQGLHARGASVTSVIGGRSKEWVIFEPELKRYGNVVVCTDDGSYGRKGFVTDAARELLEAGGIDIVYAVGPVPMMRAIANLTRPFGVHTIVSLNPVMVDGTGMCGGCRVEVGGETKFACVDGPEFDGHKVDFDLLADRLSTYRPQEQAAAERCGDNCRVGLNK